MRKHQHGTAYRYGGLSCGCVRGLTGPEVTNGEAACIAKPVFPPKRENGPCEPNTRPILWVALPGANVKPHRCCDGPAPPPPGSTLPELPAILEIVRDAQGNILHPDNQVVCLGTGGTVRYTITGFKKTNSGYMLTTTAGRSILPACVVRADCLQPFLLGSAS